MKQDMERFAARQPPAAAEQKQQQPSSSPVKEAVDKLLIADFFLVLAILGWLGAGLALKGATGSGALIDAWMPLWPLVFQPAIGVLMAGALVSGGLSWLADQRGGGAGKPHERASALHGAMDRPASRGLLAGGLAKAPTGSGVERPERPSTAQRLLGSAQGPPPGTASRGGGPPGMAFKRVAGGGAALDSALAAVPRPLTAQGMGGPRATPGPGGRQVLDRTFFVGELRQKRQQIIAAVAQMRVRRSARSAQRAAAAAAPAPAAADRCPPRRAQEELELLEQKKAAAARADKAAAQLKRDVRALQEALADSNIIIDKAGSHTPLGHIHAELADIRARNDAQHGRVEDVLSQRLALEQRTKQARAQGLQPAGSPAAGPARLPLVTVARPSLPLLPPTTRRPAQEQLKVLTERRYELAAAEKAAQASPEEQREALLARIKRDNAAVERDTARARALQDEVRALEAAAAAGPNAAAPLGQDDASRREKFGELVGKERELRAFMDAFPQRRAAKAAELAARGEAINAALARLAALRARGDGGGGGGGGGAARRELQRGNGPAAAGGAAQGEAEALAAARGELARVDGLGGKIGAELAGLRERVAALQAEAERFADVEGARGAKAATRERLEAARAEVEARRDALKAELADQAWQQQAAEAQLKANPAWPAIERLEAQARQVQAQVDAAAEFVREHAAAADFEPQRARVLELVSRVNAATVSALLSAQ
ncbi:IFT74 [Scenedesmus sp. PABB004]|nr:IFT74 [Scenedesmus sp. PABB004]